MTGPARKLYKGVSGTKKGWQSTVKIKKLGDAEIHNLSSKSTQETKEAVDKEAKKCNDHGNQQATNYEMLHQN